MPSLVLPLHVYPSKQSPLAVGPMPLGGAIAGATPAALAAPSQQGAAPARCSDHPLHGSANELSSLLHRCPPRSLVPELHGHWLAFLVPNVEQNPMKFGPMPVPSATSRSGGCIWRVDANAASCSRHGPDPESLEPALSGMFSLVVTLGPELPPLEERGPVSWYLDDTLSCRPACSIGWSPRLST
jgi:hypothetical protein